MPAMIGYRGRVHRASADIALDLVRHLTRYEVAAWTDVLDDDGEVAPAAHCFALASRLGIPCLDVLDCFGAEAFG
jgi:3,4-dihydroxy-2-butanone 4-phosphate synthase